MNYQNFKERFVEDVRQTLYEKGNMDVEVTVNQIDKLNESYEAMTILTEGNNIGINFHLEDYFEAYEDGMDYQDVVEKAAMDIEHHVVHMPEFDLNVITDYEQAKERLSIEVISAERNASVLEAVPHRVIEDMAVVYKINLEVGDDNGGTVLVNDHLLQLYGISAEQLHQDAAKNAPIIKPVIIQGMSKVISSMMPPGEDEFIDTESFEQDEIMFVATVLDKNKGAGVLAYNGFMDYAAQRLGGDFFVLPSSVHEILLVKDDGSMSYRELKEMVEQVNEAEVSPEEQLTNSVYHYDSKHKVFELGEKFEQRRSIEKIGEKTERNSVLKDLKEKQMTASEKSVVPREDKIPSSKSRGGNEL